METMVCVLIAFVIAGVALSVGILPAGVLLAVLLCGLDRSSQALKLTVAASDLVQGLTHTSARSVEGGSRNTGPGGRNSGQSADPMGELRGDRRC